MLETIQYNKFSVFKKKYFSLLSTFLNEKNISEIYLNQAYQLGEEATKIKLDVMSVATIHHDCLINFLERLKTNNHVLMANKANLLLEEMLAPFSMFSKDLYDAIKFLNKKSVEFSVRIYELHNEIITRNSVEERLKKNEIKYRNSYKKLQISFNEKENSMNEFLATVSHELRTPLNGIIGFAELMYQKTKLSSIYKEYAGDILSCSYHLLRLINHILDLTKINLGKMEVRPTLINLDQIVFDVKDTLFAVAEKNKNKIHIKIDPTLTHIIIDPEQLKRILYNFISNAIKFSPRGEKIEIFAHAEGKNFFRIEVKDYGVGIAKGDFSNLFVAFKRLNKSQKNVVDGTGLGLALVRRAVEAQGGSVGVESVLGKGSTFFAILPRTPSCSSKNKRDKKPSVMA